MSRLPKEPTDDLAQQLREVLQENSSADSGEPEEVFTSSSADKAAPDEQIAAFDTYMADLLGALGIEDGQMKPIEQEPAQEDETDMLDEPGEIDPLEPPLFDESDMPEVSEEQIEQPEISAESYDDATESIGSFEVVEQLSIQQSESTEDDVDMADDLPGEIEEIVTPEIEEEGVPSETMPEPAPTESDEMVTVEEDSVDAADEQIDVSIQEGDLLLDADDEIPPPEPAAPQETAESVAQTTAQETESEQQQESPAVPPAASPLDAAREGEAQKAAETAVPRPKQSPLDAMAAKSKGNVAAFGISSAIYGRQSRERTLTDQDVELLLDLGYDTNLTQKVGSQRVEAIRYRRREDERTRRKLRRAYGCTGEEYSDHSQDKQIAAHYRRQSTYASARLVLTVIFSIVLLLLDLLPGMLDRLPPAFGSDAMLGFCAMLGLCLVGLSAMLSWPMLLRGFRALLRFSPTPYSSASLLLLFTLLNDAVVVLDRSSDVSLNFPMGFVLTLLSVGEWMTLRREQMTFEVVSARSRKFVMEAQPPRKKKVVRDGHIVKIMDDEVAVPRFRVRPTDQVTGIFRRHGEDTPRTRALSALMVCSFAAALVVGALTLVLTGQLSSTRTAFLLTMHVCLPVASLLSYSYPMLLASKKLYAQGCAIVGQRAVDQYAGDKLMTFDDTEMFRSKSATEITIKGYGDTKKYIRYAKRLFYTLGGTLRSISTSELSEETYEERVEILKLFEQGVEARIDSKVDVLAGTAAFMVSRGVRVPDQSAELLVRRNVESSILYLAFDGKLRLGYEVDYRISGRFEQMATYLAAHGATVAIETCDPCIYDEFLDRSRYSRQTPISVVKPVRFERHTDSLICDSGVVATRSARDIAQATGMCDALMENDKRLLRFLRLMPALGTALALALTLFGRLDHSTTLLAAALQAAWCLPTLLTSRKYLTYEQYSEKKNGNER